MCAEDVHASLPISQGFLSQVIKAGGEESVRRKSAVLPQDEREMLSRSF